MIYKHNNVNMVSVMGKKRIVFSMAVLGEYFARHGSNRETD